jgi:hypothetical protein
MKKALVCLLVLAVASSTYAVGVYMAPNAGTVYDYTFGNSVAVGPNGTAYLSGQVRMDDGGYRGAYWVYSNGTLGNPIVTPANEGNTVSANAYGIGVLANGSLVVSARQPADGAATWTNLPGVGDNGHYTHFLSPGNQGVVVRDANVIRVASNGTSFYQVGKSSDSTTVGAWLVDTTTGTQTWDAFGGMSGTSSASGISANGIAAGTTKPGGINAAYVHDSNGTTLLGVPAGGSGRTEAYEISADGNVIVGAAMYDGILYQAYWKKSGGSYVADWMEDVPGATSTCAAQAVNEDGSLMGGYGYTGVYKATIWNGNDLNGLGQPKVQFLEDYLAGYGVTDLGGFTRFDRVTSISTVDGVTYIGGRGFVGSVERGFLAVVPEPATGLFLALGGLALLRRRAR